MAIHRATMSFVTTDPKGGPDIQIQEGKAYADSDPKLKALIKRFSDWFVADDQ